MSKQMIDTIMEKSVVPSFTSVGIRIRSRMFDWPALNEYSLLGRVVVITGATSGIGEAAARRYAQSGATLVIIARNAEKTAALTSALKHTSDNHNIHSVIADLGRQEDVRRAAAELKTHWPIIDVLVHNAGALFNSRQRADNGTDLSVELMVSTPFLLTALLLDNLKAAAEPATDTNRPGPPSPARVLTMSSGGMYTQALSVDGLQMSDEHYQGAKQYARAKRAQVILNEMWAERVSAREVVFHALHPGWVDTPGINDALPGFATVLSPLGLLRTADEGADTLVWLSVEEKVLHDSGRFWHDRQVRDINMTNSTRRADTHQRRNRLWQWCEAHTHWHMQPR